MKRAWRFFGIGAAYLAGPAQAGAGKGEGDRAAGAAVSLRITGERAISRLARAAPGLKAQAGRGDAAQTVNFSLHLIDITIAAPDSPGMIDVVPGSRASRVEPMGVRCARVFAARWTNRSRAGGRSWVLERGAITAAGCNADRLTALSGAVAARRRTTAASGRFARNATVASGQGRMAPDEPPAAPAIARAALPSGQPRQACNDAIAIRQTQNASNQDFPQARDDNRIGICLAAAGAWPDTRSAGPCTLTREPACGHRPGSTVDGRARKADSLPPSAIPAALEHALSGVFTLHPTDHARLGARARAWVGLTGGRRMPALG
ncbi:hypothetical protein Bsp3421_006034 [Burkholderia sp. FERM BP-3421]|uniref:hypothetical protein n=1 Tax=Burkholderia sp. FERM BP-3421 TaxID=1494466 RepID=UPI002362388C|nr:hypothetical protein [Burkholderia sp. FERM BP-3421]WDD95854.1 hypothetical protein Bsp3421_006034 [Burkholderia sp. FERM BP-3421]